MNSFKIDERPTLLLVDDEPTNLHVLRHTLQNDYRLLFAKSGPMALELARAEHPNLVLLDIMMPTMSGYEVCKALKSQSETASIPVIFVTALAEAGNEQRGLEMGAVDYIVKPFNPSIVRARVRTHLSLVHTRYLNETRLKIVRCLGTAAEYKDNETGLHVIRMSNYARIMASAAGYNDCAVNDIFHAAPMHDVGKIGIPDSILQKKGQLTAEEWIIMRRHTEIGAKIIGDHESGFLKMAATIALSHHEKWDGTGYPHGLKNEEIPHAARIVAIADVFDALTSVRPYKPAWSVEDAVAHMTNERGKQFDPTLVDIFVACLPEIMEAHIEWMDR
ncbi:response regulator [Pseudomonas putida]|uniref:response regulator n=1 Tax=Pseudomonas putida TaxID=303 RepID=UPI0018ABC452|nr:HD domain-containing phosphohydrolase [Pseudomonas putida]MBF8670255.1 response regulator [Pseudomonas putida]MBF8713129.1 response regulator [Pseudomonas putida]